MKKLLLSGRTKITPPSATIHTEEKRRERDQDRQRDRDKQRHTETGETD